MYLQFTYTVKKENRETRCINKNFNHPKIIEKT